jgi:hypothetical protein
LEKGKITQKTFQILKMKTPFEKEPHFENENTFGKRTTFCLYVLGIYNFASSYKFDE